LAWAAFFGRVWACLSGDIDLVRTAERAKFILWILRQFRSLPPYFWRWTTPPVWELKSHSEKEIKLTTP
jgi:hypothetical protein